MEEIVGGVGFRDMDGEGMVRWGFEEVGRMGRIYNY